MKLTESQQAKFDKIMKEWKAGKLHSGSPDGPIVKDQDQAIAIAYAEINSMKKMVRGGDINTKKLFDLEPGDVFEVIHPNHTVRGQLFQYIDLSDKYDLPGKYGKITVKAFPFPSKEAINNNPKKGAKYIADLRDGDIEIIDPEHAKFLLRDYNEKLEMKYNMSKYNYKEGGKTSSEKSSKGLQDPKELHELLSKAEANWSKDGGAEYNRIRELIKENRKMYYNLLNQSEANWSKDGGAEYKRLLSLQSQYYKEGGEINKMLFGGMINNLSYDAIDRMEGLAPNSELEELLNLAKYIILDLENEGFEKDEVMSFLAYKISQIGKSSLLYTESKEEEDEFVLFKLYNELSKAKNIKSLKRGYDEDEGYFVKYESGLKSESDYHKGELESYTFYVDENDKNAIEAVYDLSGNSVSSLTIKQALNASRANEDVKMSTGGGVSSNWDKLNKIAEEEYAEFGFATLNEEEMSELIDMKKASKIAEDEYGEFGFTTLDEDEMKEVIDKYPSLMLRKSTASKPKAKTSMLMEDKIKNELSTYRIKTKEELLDFYKNSKDYTLPEALNGIYDKKIIDLIEPENYKSVLKKLKYYGDIKVFNKKLNKNVPIWKEYYINDADEYVNKSPLGGWKINERYNDRKMSTGGGVGDEKNKKIMESYREWVSDLRNQSYPKMSVSEAVKQATEYMYSNYSKEELIEAIKNDRQIDMLGMEKTWLNALNRAKKRTMAKGGGVGKMTGWKHKSK